LRIYLDEEKKSLIHQYFGIDIDSELFDPRFDYVVKRIFAADTAESKLALTSFLNAALGLSGHKKIADVVVINTHVPVDDKRYKKSVFDIRMRCLEIPTETL